MRRSLSWLFAGTMLLGGLAACSDDEDDGGDDTSEEDGGSGSDNSDDSGDSGGGESGNADVQAYCDDIDALAEEIEAADGDPAALGDLADELTALGQTGADLAADAASLTPEDTEAITECGQRLTDASASLSGG